MLASFAEYDRENIRERTQAGMHRAFRSGKHFGRIPYGYDINEAGAFEVVEHEARVVREIVANVAAGASLYSEAVRLNDQGEPSPGRKYRGKPRAHGASWHQSTVREMVVQTTYAGTHGARRRSSHRAAGTGHSGPVAAREGPRPPGGEQALLRRQARPRLSAARPIALRVLRHGLRRHFQNERG